MRTKENNYSIKKIDFECLKEQSFLSKVFSSPDANLFWGRNDDFSNFKKIKNKLKSNWGAFELYILYFKKKPYGLLGIYNVSKKNQRANLFVWLSQEKRNSVFLVKWWLLFLQELQNAKILNLFARIKSNNVVAINATKKFGFVKTGFLPDYFYNSGVFEGVDILHRKSRFSNLENKFFNKFFNY